MRGGDLTLYIQHALRRARLGSSRLVDREVARRLYNRESAKLSAQRRTSYLIDLQSDSQALQAALDLRLAQVELLERVTRKAQCQMRVKTDPAV